MKTLVIVGGSFNPITKAHLSIGQYAKQILPNADIVYVPSNMDYIKHWKNTNYGVEFSPKKREELLKIALLSEGFLLDMREANGELSGKTYDLVMDYKSKGYDKIYFCIGGDKINELPKWYKSEELLKESQVILFSRGSTFIDLSNPFYDGKVDKLIKGYIPEEFKDISSSKVREAFKNNKLEDVKDMLPLEVYNVLQRRCTM